MGIVLSSSAATAWRKGGEQWKAVSSRIVTARLKLDNQTYVHLVSVYAPTFRSSQEIKDDFFADLQDTLNNVPDKDILLLMGDWNARVGSCQAIDQWNGAVGKHGIGDLNEAGIFLLSFCCSNDLTNMNTCFQKKTIHKHFALAASMSRLLGEEG